MPTTTDSTGKPTNTPTQKVTAGGLAGAVSILVVWGLNTFVFKKEVITGTIASAITTILSFVVAYLIPPGSNESVG
jgi:hypothetical protein